MSSEDKAEKSPWDSKTSEMFESKRPGEFLDPCQEAASRSLKCLHRNGGDRDMCADYFQYVRIRTVRAHLNMIPEGTIFSEAMRKIADDGLLNRAYRDCKKQWIMERKEARRKEGKSWFS